MTKPKMKRRFIVTSHTKRSRRITFESASDAKTLLGAYGEIYGDTGSRYVLYVSELYDFYEVLDHLRTRQLLLSGFGNYEDTSEDAVKEEPEKPFDWNTFIDEAISYIERSEPSEEPTFEYPFDDEEEAPSIIINIVI